MNLSEPRELAPLLEAFLLASGKPQSLERLYELFQEYARARGCTKLTAVTDPSNANSIAFHTGKIGMRCSIVKDYGGPGEDRAVFEKEI